MSDDALAVVKSDTAQKEDDPGFAVVDPSTGGEEIQQHEQPVNKTVEDFQEQFTKLIYVFDCSGSMGAGVDPDEQVQMYVWTPELLEQIRIRLGELAVGHNADEQAAGGTEVLSREDFCAEVLNVDFNSDEAIKRWALDYGLHRNGTLPLERNSDFRPTTRSRLDMVKDAAEKFVHLRYDRHPHAIVSVFGFSYLAVKLTRKFARREDVVKAIREDLNLSGDFGGGTNIYRAVSEVLADCGKAKQVWGANHIVLVSDGLDHGAVNVRNFLPVMKDLRVVFDFIYVRSAVDEQYRTTYQVVIDALKEVRGETGGEYSEVSKESDFGRKFFEASSRKCLPPVK